MSLPDPTAAAALYEAVIKPVFFVNLAFDDAPVLANTSGADLTPSGTGNPKLDGLEFLGVEGQFVDLSPVKDASGGSRSITATLSGIPTDAVDAEILAFLDDDTKWRAHDADVFAMIRDAANVQQGGYMLWASGKVVALNHGGGVRGLKITVHIEGYLAAVSEASNRTYLDQELFDPTDLSARASLGIANGNFNNPIVNRSGYSNGYDPFSGQGFPPFGGIF